MKYLPSILAIGLLAFPLQAQKAVPPGDTGDPFVKNGDPAATNDQGEDHWLQCVITIDAYALEKNEAADLLGTEHGSAARYRRVLELAKAGKAHLELLESLTTKSGQRALVEAIDEVRYPVEFASAASTKSVALPTAWETRNVGDTFELEPVILPDGRTCDINLVPSRTSLVEFRDLPEATEGLTVSQPIFNTQKITTSVAVTDGEPHYLGTLTPPTGRGMANGTAPSEIQLAFLHMSLQGPPRAKAKPKTNKPPKPEAAQGPAAPEAPVEPVELQFSCYSLDLEPARDILTSTSISTPWQKVKALLAEKKARLEHLSTIKTKSGQRAVAEEIQEVRFVSEYSPEHRQSSSEITQRTVNNQIGEKKADAKPDSTSNSTETITTTRTAADAELIPGQASAFEVHNVGTTMEVEPVVSPDRMTVDINAAIQSTKLIGNLKVTGIATHYPAQPLFEDSKITTALSLPFDLPVLVGTLNPPAANGVNGRADAGRTYLLFVQATLGEP